MKRFRLIGVLLWIIFIAFASCKHDTPDIVVQELKPVDVSTFISLKNITRPNSLAIDKSGNLYFADGTASIYKVTSDGKVSIYAGANGYGYEDGTLAKAKFLWPFGLVFDSGDNLYVADSGNRAVRKITPDGQVSTVAGKPYNADTTNSICVDGIGTNARFVNPYGLAIDKSDNLYVVEYTESNFYSSVVRKVTPDAKVTTIAGIPGKISDSVYHKPETIAFPTSAAVSKSGDVYIGTGTGVIHKISSSGQVTLFSGKRDTFVMSMNGGNGSVQLAQYGFIGGLAFDAYDNLYVGEIAAGIVRKISPDGQVTNVTGNRYGGYKDGPLDTAEFGGVWGLVFDKSGSLFVADLGNTSIRKITFK